MNPHVVPVDELLGSIYEHHKTRIDMLYREIRAAIKMYGSKNAFTVKMNGLGDVALAYVANEYRKAGWTVFIHNDEYVFMPWGNFDRASHVEVL